MTARPEPRPADRRVAVAAATLGMGAGFGAMTTVSSLIGPLESELGALRAEVSLAYTLITLGTALGGLVVGRLTDRFPSRPIAMAGAAIVGLALILAAVQTRLGAIHAIYLTAGFLGFSCLYGPLLTTTALWFPERGGFALGLVTMGGAVGQGLVPPLFEALAAAFGWRGGLMLLGLLYLAAIAPAMWFVEKPPAAAVAGAGGPAARGWPLPPPVTVALLAGAAMLCCVVMGTPLVHLMPLALAGGAETASAAMTAMMAAGCASRLAAGAIADRIGALSTYALFSAAQTAAVCLFIAPPQGAELIAAAAAYGLAFGGVMTGLVCTVKAAVPAPVLGRAMSAVGLTAWLGMGLGGYQGGLCFDLTGSYAASFANAALAGAANLALLALLGLLLRRAESRSPTGWRSTT